MYPMDRADYDKSVRVAADGNPSPDFYRMLPYYLHGELEEAEHWRVKALINSGINAKPLRDETFKELRL